MGFELVRDERHAEQPSLAPTRDEAQIGAAKRPEVDPDPPPPPIGVELVLEVDDLDLCHDRVQGAGWPTIDDIASRPWGMRGSRMLDPKRLLPTG